MNYYSLALCKLWVRSRYFTAVYVNSGYQDTQRKALCGLVINPSIFSCLSSNIAMRSNGFKGNNEWSAVKKQTDGNAIVQFMTTFF